MIKRTVFAVVVLGAALTLRLRGISVNATRLVIAMLLLFLGVLVLTVLFIGLALRASRRSRQEIVVVEESRPGIARVEIERQHVKSWDMWLADYPVPAKALIEQDAWRRGTEIQMLALGILNEISSGMSFDRCVYYSPANVFLLFPSIHAIGLGVSKLVGKGVLDDLGYRLGAPVKVPAGNLVYIVYGINDPGVERCPQRVVFPDMIPAGKFPLGVDSRAHWIPWSETQHILVGGATRSGKSNYVRGIVAAALNDDMRVLIVDVAKGGLDYAFFRERCEGWANTIGEAHQIFEQLIVECNTRRQAFYGIASNLSEYNAQADMPFPRILCVVDEFSALMIDDPGNELMKAFVRLVSTSGAFGVHVLAATQYPKASMMDTLARGQFDTRVCFRVTTKQQARAVLGEVPPRWMEEATAMHCKGRAVAAHGVRVMLLQTYLYEVTAIRHKDKAFMSSDEWRLADLIFDKFEGEFNVGALYDVVGPRKAGGISKSRITKIGQAWERRGWLSRYEWTESGKSSRRATEALRVICDMRAKDDKDVDMLAKRCESPIEEAFFRAAYQRIANLKPNIWIGPYRVDFCVPDKGLVIELDGHAYHASREQRTHDAKRERYLEAEGWRVIRFTGTEINRDVDACVSEVEKLLEVVKS